MADIQMSDKQIQEAVEAQARFTGLKSRGLQLDQPRLDLLFNEGQSQNGWQDKPVGEDILRELYDLVRMGALSMTTAPLTSCLFMAQKRKKKLSRP